MTTRIPDDGALRRLAEDGDGFIIDPFNRRWHRIPCPRLALLTTKQAKHHVRTADDLRAFAARRMRENATAKALEACPTCGPEAGREKSSSKLPTVAGVDLQIRTVAGGFVASSSHRVTYGPAPGSAAHEVRSALRARLASIEPQQGEVLHAVFGGRLPPRSDVENQLLYNVMDAASARALARGVRFEHDGGHAGRTFEFRYRTAGLDAGFRHWRIVRDRVAWPAVTVSPGGQDGMLARVWWSLREVRPQAASPGPSAAFGMRLEISPPHAVRLGTASLKSIVDGVVSAFQTHDAGSEAIRRIAHLLGVAPEAVSAELRNDPRAVLGRAQETIRLTERNVQWGPDDTRLVAVDVRVVPARSDHWVVAGQCFDVTSTVEAS